MKINNNNNICNNCFKIGHQIHSCKLPIQSYGVIVFRYSKENNIEYLMIRRKDSFSYIDLIRGKYSPNNIEQLQNIIDNITIEEKERLLNRNYEYLRNILWLSDILPVNYKIEDINAQKKFENIKYSNNDFTNSYSNNNNNKIVNLKNIIEKSTTRFIDQEWEFPKGRKNINEKDLECALREFEEETGYSKNSIEIINNIIPYDEIFIGSNYKSYKHRYFIGYMKESFNYQDPTNYQKLEVSKVEWKTFEECLENIRPNCIEKKRVLINVNMLLTKHKICKMND
jgi:8-oxo-dGTP pyrophosphatase MutT (NUDIX family)